MTECQNHRTLVLFKYDAPSRGRATVARQAHNLKIVGSIPTPATIYSRPKAKYSRIPQKLFCTCLSLAVLHIYLKENLHPHERSGYGLCVPPKHH